MSALTGLGEPAPHRIAFPVEFLYRPPSPKPSPQEIDFPLRPSSGCATFSRSHGRRISRRGLSRSPRRWKYPRLDWPDNRSQNQERPNAVPSPGGVGQVEGGRPKQSTKISRLRRCAGFRGITKRAASVVRLRLGLQRDKREAALI